MSARRLVVAAMIVIALASCGSNGESGASPSPSTDRDDVTVEWFLRAISEDELRIDVVYTISGVASDCERKGSAVAKESDATVALTATKSVTTDRNRACTEELGYVEESVTLQEPLGDRALVGCRPGKLEPSEDSVCRDLERSRSAGIFEFSPPPGGGY